MNGQMNTNIFLKQFMEILIFFSFQLSILIIFVGSSFCFSKGIVLPWSFPYEQAIFISVPLKYGTLYQVKAFCYYLARQRRIDISFLSFYRGQRFINKIVEGNYCEAFEKYCIFTSAASFQILGWEIWCDLYTGIFTFSVLYQVILICFQGLDPLFHILNFG